MIGKILTNCWKFVKFVNIFPRQKFAPYGMHRTFKQDCNATIKFNLSCDSMAADNRDESHSQPRNMFHHLPQQRRLENDASLNIGNKVAANNEFECEDNTDDPPEETASHGHGDGSDISLENESGATGDGEDGLKSLALETRELWNPVSYTVNCI